MDVQGMITDLQARRVQLDNAISVISGLNGHEAPKKEPERPRAAKVQHRARRVMSAATRRKMSRLMKQRWAASRKAGSGRLMKRKG